MIFWQMELLIGLITGILLGAGFIVVIYQLVWVGPMAREYAQLKQKSARQLHELRTRLRRLSRRYTEEQRRLAAADLENAALRTRLEHTAYLAEELQAASAASQQWQTELAEARQEISQRQARLDAACQRLHDEQQRSKATASQYERFQATLVVLAREAGRWAALAAERQAQMDRLAAAQIEAVPIENETLHHQLARLETALAEMPGKMAQLAQPGFAAARSPLQQIRGIGPVYARRLQEAGIHTLADFLGQAPEQLRQITGTTQRQGGPDAWLAEAQKIMAKAE